MPTENRSSNTEIKPCPFCGGKAESRCTAGPDPDWFVQCTECRASADVFSEDNLTGWNNRALAAEQHQGEPVALPSCKAKLSMSHDWDQGHSDGWKDCLEEISKLGPLYTHADSDSLQRSWQAGYDTAWYAKNPAEKRTSVNPADAGELELARKMLRSVRRREEKWALLCGGRNNQIATLRAQLAEQEHSARELLRIIGMSVQGSAAYNRAVIAFHDSLNADTKPS